MERLEGTAVQTECLERHIKELAAVCREPCYGLDPVRVLQEIAPVPAESVRMLYALPEIERYLLVGEVLLEVAQTMNCDGHKALADGRFEVNGV